MKRKCRLQGRDSVGYSGNIKQDNVAEVDGDNERQEYVWRGSQRQVRYACGPRKMIWILFLVWWEFMQKSEM